MYTCPVCGYARLLYPPADYTICPSCYTEFGLDDAELSHDELRRRWMSNGMPWMGANVTPPPPGWNPIAQLINIGAIEYEETVKNTATKIDYVSLAGEVTIEVQQGVVNITARLFRNIADVVKSATPAHT